MRHYMQTKKSVKILPIGGTVQRLLCNRVVIKSSECLDTLALPFSMLNIQMNSLIVACCYFGVNWQDDYLVYSTVSANLIYLGSWCIR